MKSTLLILLDAFRHDYLHPKDTPFLWELKKQSVYAKKLYNPGGYCERSVFMTGADPHVTDNYFAMALMPVGYKRPYWEPRFNVPPMIRDRLCMTEDQIPDFEPNAFKVESFWDKLRENDKTFAVEACIALGILSYNGVTTHGTRPIQLADKFKDNHDLYYIQYSETDQQMHYKGTDRDQRKHILRWVDGSVNRLVEQARETLGEVNIIVFGDHGMDNVKKRLDVGLDYPELKLGWDYLYLKSSAAVQFWTFSKKADKYILGDKQLTENGRFIKTPDSNQLKLSDRQGSIIWESDYGTLVRPCHFHPANDPIVAMHGRDANHHNQKGMAIVYDGEHKGEVDHCRLNDITPTVCDLVGVGYPKHNKGKSLIQKGGEQ